MTYQSKDIEVLTGLEPVQRRPGMYTDTAKPNHLVQEVLDNSVDEALAGHAKEITITLFEDGSIEVIDDGRGMPVDIHPAYGVTGVELIMTRLHSGGKFSKKNYQFSGGLHGVGLSVVNALSKQVVLHIKRGGKEYLMKFERGEKKTELQEIRSVNSSHTGTAVRFWPDPQYFDSPKISLAELKQILKAKAVLSPGLRINFFDEKTKESLTWSYKEGLKEYFLNHLDKTKSLPLEGFIGRVAYQKEEVEWAVAWSEEARDHREYLTESYVNLIPTAEGGTHVNGLRTGLFEAFSEFCELHELLPRGIKLAPEDSWKNCNYILAVKLSEPQFSGQTKARLTSRECALWVGQAIKDNLSLYLNQHAEVAKKIAEQIIEHAEKRIKQAKTVTRKKIAGGPALPGKLADCLSQNLNETELFLVEGDSAGGSAKQARDRRFQAIMPLRGKILNAWEIASNEVLASQEIHDIAVAIGVDPGQARFNELRYGKICILADADSDGLHIATLLCALFLKHFSNLVKEGHIFVAMPPLYRLDAGKKTYYALDDEEKEKIIKKLEGEKRNLKINVQRFKGLGEMNPAQLRETTMQPDTRRLVQLTLNDDRQTSEEIMDMLLAKKRSAERRMWLEKKGNLVELI